MRKITGTGIGFMLVGLVGLAGAIDTNRGWNISLWIFGIGILLALIGNTAEYWSETYEDIKKDNSINRGSSHDASYPAYLRR